MVWIFVVLGCGRVLDGTAPVDPGAAKLVPFLPVVGTWEELESQPAHELEGGATVRLGIEVREVPRRCGALVYCLTEGFDRPTKWRGDDHLGPLRVAVSRPGDIQTLAPASEHLGPTTRRSGSDLYVFPILVTTFGDYRIRLKTPEGKTVAAATVTGADQAYHPWMPFGWLAGKVSRLEEDASEQARTVARVSNRVYGTALPYWNGMTPFRRGGSRNVVRALLPDANSTTGLFVSG